MHHLTYVTLSSPFTYRRNALFVTYITETQLEKVEISGIEYIHGSWRRQLNIDEDNKWVEPINDYDDICWTTISSKEHNPNARASESGYFVDKESVEIHCDVGQKSLGFVHIVFRNSLCTFGKQ